MNKEILKLRDYYKEDSLAEERVDLLWQELSGKLPDRQYHKHRHTFQYATFFATMTLFFAVSMVAIQAAAPSSPLYPVKMLSETTAAKLSGKYDNLIEHRTDAIINAAQKKSEVEIRKAAVEYEATLKEAQERKQTDDKAKERLKETLKKSEEKLKAITPGSTNAQNLLNQSINATEKTRQEVRGASTSSGNAANPSAENKQSPTQKPESPGNSENAGNNGSSQSGNSNVPQSPGQSGEEHGKKKN